MPDEAELSVRQTLDDLNLNKKEPNWMVDLGDLS
jgi:hypothetical protein